MDRSTPLTVTELTRHIKGALEAAFPPLWVEGEISDFNAASSGHLYFTLKDENTQIRAVMFRRDAGRLPFLPAGGMHVLLLARLTVYEARGNYQIIVEDIEPRGVGAIRQALEQLRQALDAEGLFHPDRKRPLPTYPACIGVVTSPTGAAIQDILKVIRNMDAPVRVLLAPALVQGRDAPESLVQALADLSASDEEIDVIIIGRGGGSYEDLLAFSDERVVRAVADCPIRVVSAVGHETDVALTDLAADARAATPSAAAELVTQGRDDLLAGLEYYRSRLSSAARLAVGEAREQLAAVGSRLVHPRHILDQGRMRLDDLSFRLVSHTRSRLAESRSDLKHLAGLLNSLGPQAVLDRGYSVVSKKDGSIVRGPDQVEVGEGLDVRVAAGRIKVKVEALRPRLRRGSGQAGTQGRGEKVPPET
ncbi:MAG: exodeoxyribonuclease VII large subunit [bacterium]|nr:exodeoxyribonuclease VII large subunit [bacterium]